MRLVHRTQLTAVICATCLWLVSAVHASADSVLLERSTVTGSQPVRVKIVPTPSLGSITYNIKLSGTNQRPEAPASITIPAGQTSGEFVLKTSPAQSDQFVDITVTRTGIGGTSASARLNVVPAVLLDMSLDRNSVVGGSPGGAVTVTTNIDVPAPPGGVDIDLVSSCALLNKCPVMSVSKLKIPAGSRSGVLAVEFTPAVERISVTISATFETVSKSKQVNVDPLIPMTLTLSPSTVHGGDSVTMTIALNAPAYGDYRIQVGCLGFPAQSLSGACSAVANQDLTFSSGQTSTTFSCTAVNVSTARDLRLVVSSASTNSRETAFATLTILP